VRIGYFTDKFPYQNPITGNVFKQYSTGGVGAVVYNLTVQMAKRGHEVYVFTTAKDEGSSLSKYDNISIIRYKSNFTIGQNPIALKHLTRPFFSSVDLDIAHSHIGNLPAPVGGAIYAKRKNIPFIITHHGDWIGGFGTLGRRAGVFLYNYFLCDWLFSQSYKIIALSKSHLIGSKILKKYQNKTTIIPNGINARDFQIPQSQGECRDILNLPAEKKIILFLGSLVTQKGPQILLSAMKAVQRRYPDAYLVIGGSGHLKKDLIETTTRSKLKDDVVFTGYIPTDRTPLYYRAADIFVLPSFSEAFPLTLLEAGAAGLPIIATDVGGVSDILHDGINGVITKTGDPEDLAGKIVSLLDDDELREKLGKKGQMLAEQYSWEKVAEETEKVYLDLIRRGN
jgi:glycosyltransferase involved in cell wall biosynthesis